MTVTQPTPSSASGTTHADAETVGLSVAIMAHPARADLVTDLCERLGIGEDRVVWDRYGDRWDTGVRAWEHHDPDADWHLVLQDDALPCRDLLPALRVGLGVLPDDCTASLYWGHNEPRIDRQIQRHAKAPWLRRRWLTWGVAMLVPTYAIEPMLEYCQWASQPTYDYRISCFFRQFEWPSYHAWPALVDHRGDHSLINGSPGRRAQRFVGEDFSALDITWSTRPPQPRRTDG